MLQKVQERRSSDTDQESTTSSQEDTDSNSSQSQTPVALVALLQFFVEVEQTLSKKQAGPSVSISQIWDLNTNTPDTVSLGLVGDPKTDLFNSLSRSAQAIVSTLEHNSSVQKQIEACVANDPTKPEGETEDSVDPWAKVINTIEN